MIIRRRIAAHALAAVLAAIPVTTAGDVLGDAVADAREAVSVIASEDCRVDGHVRTCAPAFSLTGAPILPRGVEEDGSAGYTDGMEFDPTDGWSVFPA